jgi:voltage-gated potassium channel
MARKKRYTVVFYKELFLSALAVISVALVAYELLASPSNEQIRQINHFDFAVALLFLIDFFIGLYQAVDKKRYFRKNWFLLIASIPLVDGWAEMLRALRLLVLFRIVRAGEHIVYIKHASKN